MGRKYTFEEYWDLFWITGMPEAFGVYRLSKDLDEKMVDGDGFDMLGDPPNDADPM